MEGLYLVRANCAVCSASQVAFSSRFESDISFSQKPSVWHYLPTYRAIPATFIPLQGGIGINVPPQIVVRNCDACAFASNPLTSYRFANRYTTIAKGYDELCKLARMPPDDLASATDGMERSLCPPTPW